jgi:hypothetical protein
VDHLVGEHGAEQAVEAGVAGRLVGQQVGLAAVGRVAHPTGPRVADGAVDRDALKVGGSHRLLGGRPTRAGAGRTTPRATDAEHLAMSPFVVLKFSSSCRRSRTRRRRNRRGVNGGHGAGVFFSRR